MTQAETRGAVTAYYRIRSVLDQPLPDALRDSLNTALQAIASDCQAATQNSAPTRWSRSHVGPILTAAITAAVYMRDVATPNGALKIFGLAGDHPLSSHAAWRMVQPYLSEPVLSEQTVEEIRTQSSLRLKLSKNPTPSDVLEELTRNRGGGFPSIVGHWVVEYFQEHPDLEGPYGERYRTALADVSDLNSRREIPINTNCIHGRLDRQAWQALSDGRLPQEWLQLRAGYAAARQYVADYWQKWQTRSV